MPETIPGIGDEVLVGLFLCIALLYFVYIGLGKLNFQSETEMSTPGGRVQVTPQDCVICLDEAKFAIETNCGHIYCANCILTYFGMSGQSPFNAQTCPYCRQRMTLLLPYFTDEERNAAELPVIEERDRYCAELRAYNQRFSGQPRSIIEQIYDIPVMIRHLWSFLWTTEGLSWLFRMRIFAFFGVAFLYLLSPLDILPEAVFGIVGFIDDFLVAALLLLYVSNQFRNFISQYGGGLGMQT